MKVLNLYAGLGGNRKNWTGCQVTAVEKDARIAAVYQSLFPADRVVVGDAHEFLQSHYKEYDFVWSSPPCQSHSKMMLATRHDVARYPDMKLYEEIIFLKTFYRGKWVVENVRPYYQPLILPTQRIGRHLFWANFDFMALDVQPIKGFWTDQNIGGADALKAWLGIRFDGNIYYEKNHSPTQVLRNCVHPAIGLHIFEAALASNLRPNIP